MMSSQKHVLAPVKLSQKHSGFIMIEPFIPLLELCFKTCNILDMLGFFQHAVNQLLFMCTTVLFDFNIDQHNLSQNISRTSIRHFYNREILA